MNSEKIGNLIHNSFLLIMAILIFLFGRYSKQIEAEFIFPYEIKRDETNNQEIEELITSFADDSNVNKTETDMITKTEGITGESLNIDYLFAASKNGKKYYPKDSKSINRIKVENRVYFKTEENAIKAGYSK